MSKVALSLNTDVKENESEAHGKRTKLHIQDADASRQSLLASQPRPMAGGHLSCTNLCAT